MMELEQRLADAGYRITAPRRAVIEIMLQSESPLSPQEIFEQGRAIHPKLGLVTVYRTLALLEAFSLVRRVHRDDGCHGYVLASPGHRHPVVCRECGRTVEFLASEDLDTLIAQVEQSTGYRVEDHLLQLEGLCPDCQEAAV
jgi:Fur family ferric uptake transcriptional regulator